MAKDIEPAVSIEIRQRIYFESLLVIFPEACFDLRNQLLTWYLVACCEVVHFVIRKWVVFDQRCPLFQHRIHKGFNKLLLTSVIFCKTPCRRENGLEFLHLTANPSGTKAPSLAKTESISSRFEYQHEVLNVIWESGARQFLRVSG